jgi:hypothetical protein
MSKYHAKPTTVDGIRFASKAEARRWQHLMLMQKAGYIRDLQRQVPFELAPAVIFMQPKKRKKPALRYVADATYTDAVTGEFVVEDVKGGAATPLFRAKKHLMLSVHGIEVREVRT